MNLLAGQIFWVSDDFKYNDSLEREFEHTAAKISDVVVDENMVKFTVQNPGYLLYTYEVQLIREDIGTNYSGTFRSLENLEYFGQVKCELFENETKILLYGCWLENETEMTWWAMLKK